MRQWGSAEFQDSITANGEVSGAIETGVTSFSESIGGASNWKDISLSKGGWTHGMAMLIFDTAVAIGQKGIIIHFTDVANTEADAQEFLAEYGSTYSRNAGAAFLSGQLSNNIRIDGAYIENSTPSIRINFYNASSPSGSRSLVVSVHWVVFQ